MIEVTNGLYITADQNQYIVGKLDKKGKMQNSHCYTTMPEAVKSVISILMRKKVQDGSITTLNNYIQEMKEISNSIDQFVSGLDVKVGEEV